MKDGGLKMEGGEDCAKVQIGAELLCKGAKVGFEGQGQGQGQGQVEDCAKVQQRRSRVQRCKGGRGDKGTRGRGCGVDWEHGGGRVGS